MSRNQTRSIEPRTLYRSTDANSKPSQDKRKISKVSRLSPYSRRNGGSQPRSRLGSSLQMRTSSQTTPESANKSNLKLNITTQSTQSQKYGELVTEEQLTFLKEELEHYWGLNDIPEIHRNAFKDQHYSKTIDKQAIIIGNEINSLEEGSSPIQLLLAAIKERDCFIQNLKEINQKIAASKNKSSTVTLKREFTSSLVKLRDLSLSVIERVFEWRESLRNIRLKFVRNEVDLFMRMRYEMNFLQDTWIGETVKIPEEDPFLLCLSQNHKRSRSQSDQHEGSVNLPMNYAILSRIKQGMLALGMSLIEKPKPQPQESSVHVNIINVAKVIVQKHKDIFLTENKQPKLEYHKEAGELLLLNWIDEMTDQKITEVFYEAKSEMISASIKLYASNILDRIIVTTLGSLLPEISLEAYTEIIDYEYIDLRDSIIHDSIYEEVLESVEELSKNLLADEIAIHYLQNIKIDDIVQGCISHERDLNDNITQLIYKELVESMVNEEWAEILVENEIGESKLDRVREQLPYSVQREIIRQESSRFNQRIYEMLYFDILNRFVGEIWLGNMIKSSMQEMRGLSEASIEEMFPLKDPDIPIEDPAAAKNKPVPLIKSVFHRH